MELRVWVDGTQRVVCGVKLTTTCHEIVFALAHATQQAGRFTMIERWRNNERLLSPNEQPLVTLQRWGDHMNEVEFILRKTSTDPPQQPQTQSQPQPQLPTNHNQANQLQTTQPQHQSPNKPGPTAALPDPARASSDIQPPPQQQQQIITNANQGTTTNPLTSSSSQILNDQTYDNMFRQRPYSLNATRRPQTIHGQLTSSNSNLSLAPNYLHNSHHALNRLSASFRPSLSASTLPSATNNMSASPSNMMPMIRARFADDQMMSSNALSMSNNYQNGYSIQSETQYQQQTIANQAGIDQGTRNNPFEDLYGTINKKRNNQPPPVVPAKPRVLNNLGGMQQMSQNIYNTQMNYYHPNQSPSLCPTTMRPRHPPGYLDYMEAIASKNSLSQPMISKSNHLNQSQNMRSNMFPRSYDPHPAYSYRQNSVSPPNSSKTTNNYCYQANGQTNLVSHAQNHDGSPNLQNFNNPINSKLIDSGIVINRGSAVNIKLPSSIQNHISHSRNVSDERLDTSAHSNASSVSQIGHDMLKVIEEQKRLLVNQKNELEKLDNDQEYWEAKQISEQTELVNRIENEILQLEKLWKDNQTQIKKLENQDFEEVLENLKSEQVKIELEIQKQQGKLLQLDNDIIQCKNKIEQLEAELARQDHNDSPPNDDKNDERKSTPKCQLIQDLPVGPIAMAIKMF